MIRSRFQLRSIKGSEDDKHHSISPLTPRGVTVPSASQ